jgi:hypothetical protein
LSYYKSVDSYESCYEEVECVLLGSYMGSILGDFNAKYGHKSLWNRQTWTLEKTGKLRKMHNWSAIAFTIHQIWLGWWNQWE